MRTLLPGSSYAAFIYEVHGTAPGALPTAIGHVLIFSYTVVRGLLSGRIVGDVDASAGIVDQLVSFLRLLLVPLIVNACESAHFVDGLPGTGWDSG
jgi:hypothetical protein